MSTIQTLARCCVDRFRHAELVFDELLCSAVVETHTELVDQHGAANRGHKCTLLRAEIVDRKCALALFDNSNSCGSSDFELDRPVYLALAGPQVSTTGCIVPLPTADYNYHIDPGTRSRLQPGVDADALERLLQYFPAESRPLHLEMFSSRDVVVDGDGRAPDLAVLDRISHPVLQQLLEEVWQPFWASVPDTELERLGGGPPGRELARQRRAQPPSR